MDTPSKIVKELAACLYEAGLIEDSPEMIEIWLLRWFLDYGCRPIPMKDV